MALFTLQNLISLTIKNDHKISGTILKTKLNRSYPTSSALWKHHVNLLLQSFRSLSSDLLDVFLPKLIVHRTIQHDINK